MIVHRSVPFLRINLIPCLQQPIDPDQTIQIKLQNSKDTY